MTAGQRQSATRRDGTCNPPIASTTTRNRTKLINVTMFDVHPEFGLPIVSLQGRLVANKKTFHSKGLKLGIYSDAG
jgi:hypothetical protein